MTSANQRPIRPMSQSLPAGERTLHVLSLRNALSEWGSNNKQQPSASTAAATSPPRHSFRHRRLKMPGRPSTRTARSSNAAPARKSSTTTLRSARTSAYAVEVPDEGPETALRTQISHIFSDAQNTTATQRKLQINLRKLQERCCFEPQEVKKNKAQQDEQFDEDDFNTEVTRCVVRILNVKKGEPVGDRIIRFLGLFLKHASDKGRVLMSMYSFVRLY